MKRAVWVCFEGETPVMWRGQCVWLWVGWWTCNVSMTPNGWVEGGGGWWGGCIRRNVVFLQPRLFGCARPERSTRFISAVPRRIYGPASCVCSQRAATARIAFVLRAKPGPPLNLEGLGVCSCRQMALFKPHLSLGEGKKTPQQQLIKGSKSAVPGPPRRPWQGPE